MKETSSITTKLHEVAIVYKRPVFNSMPQISHSNDGYSILLNLIDKGSIDHKECFWILLLNRANRVLGFSEIGKGDTTGVVVNVKEIFQLAILSNASAIILCHNHPSGNLNSSEQDKKLTKRVKDIGKMMSITLLDHLILTSEGYHSFADSGEIS